MNEQRLQHLKVVYGIALTVKVGDQATIVACATELQPQFETLKAALKGAPGQRRKSAGTT